MSLWTRTCKVWAWVLWCHVYSGPHQKWSYSQYVFDHGLFREENFISKWKCHHCHYTNYMDISCAVFCDFGDWEEINVTCYVIHDQVDATDKDGNDNGDIVVGEIRMMNRLSPLLRHNRLRDKTLDPPRHCLRHCLCCPPPLPQPLLTGSLQ